MKTSSLIIVLALIVGVIIIVIMSPRSAPSSIAQLSGTSFVQAFKNTSGATLLDVRTPEEYTEGHILGATNIDIEGESFVSSINALDRDKPYFVYCRSGNRSGQAVAFMKQQGFTHITELRGGILSSPELVQQ